MLSEKEFCEEALAVLKWLIAIPSITRTAGDEIINHPSISYYIFHYLSI